MFTFVLSLDEAPVVEPILSVYKEAARTGVHRTIHAAEASGSDAVERVSALCLELCYASFLSYILNIKVELESLQLNK